MSKELIDKLAELKLEKNSLLRATEYKFNSNKKREKLFFRLKDVNKEIEKTKFMLRLEREICNGDNNTNKSNN